MNKIEEAFWALNAACATETKHEDFLITELDHIKGRLETESTGSKVTWFGKRAVGLITMAIIGAIGLIAAIPITLAVENRAQQIQLDSLHNTIGPHYEAIKFIEDAIEPIEFITAASTSANHRISNGVLLAEEVTDRLGNFINHQNGKFITTEKNTARAIATASSYWHTNTNTNTN